MFTPGPFNADELHPFFADIDFSEDIVMLNGKFDWEEIKKRLLAMTKSQQGVFNTFPFGVQ